MTADVLAFLLQGLPAGQTENVWDFAPSPSDPDFYEEWRAIAQALDTFVVGRLEAMTREQNPATAVEKLPDFEQLMGLSFSDLVVRGTTEQRQAQVVSRIREPGAATLPGIRALLQPYLRYDDPSQIQVLETDRAALTAAHSYAFPGLPAAMPVAGLFDVVDLGVIADGGRVSDAGAQVFVTVTGPIDSMAFVLTCTGAEPVNFLAGSLGIGGVTNTTFVLQAPELAGVSLDARPAWKLFYRSLGNAATLESAALFVEGIGRDAAGVDALGAVIFEWAVVVDPLLTGAGADLIGAAAAVQRIAPAHTQATLFVKKGGNLLAIPDLDTTLPDTSIPS